MMGRKILKCERDKGKEDVDLEQQRGQQQGMPLFLVLFFFNS
jgi:hypothetical protein